MKLLEVLKQTRFVSKMITRFSEKPKIFGRWNRELSQQQLIRRIELANEDHCGPCGEYVLQKRRHEDSYKMKAVNKKK